MFHRGGLLNIEQPNFCLCLEGREKGGKDVPRRWYWDPCSRQPTYIGSGVLAALASERFNYIHQ